MIHPPVDIYEKYPLWVHSYCDFT